MKIRYIITSALFLTVAIIIPFYFNEILFYTTTSFGLGWVTTTILIRMLVILFFAGCLAGVFKLFQKSKHIKFYWIFLIALLPGFGISFISPIYESDYGMLNDGMELTNADKLIEKTKFNFIPEKGFAICTFFTSTCPFCKSATQKLGANIKAGQEIPVYAFFPGNKEDTEAFLTNNDGNDFTYFLIDDDSFFLNVSGGAFPSIFVINSKGETEYHWTGDEMNYSALDYLKSLEQ